MKKLFRATTALSFALASGVAVAQEPPAAPVPKLPAMPSLEQKGSDDMTKPAGASAGKVVKTTPEPKHAGKDAKKREPEAPAPTPKAPVSSQRKEPAAKPKASAAKSEAPGAKRKPTAKAAATAKHAATNSKARKPTPAKKSRRGK